MLSKTGCPRCGGKHVIAYGKPRMLCKDCERTFSGTTGTVMCSTKLRPEKFRAMVNLMLNDVELKAICDSVGGP